MLGFFLISGVIEQHVDADEFFIEKYKYFLFFSLSEYFIFLRYVLIVVLNLFSHMPIDHEIFSKKN